MAHLHRGRHLDIPCHLAINDLLFHPVHRKALLRPAFLLLRAERLNNLNQGIRLTLWYIPPPSPTITGTIPTASTSISGAILSFPPPVPASHQGPSQEYQNLLLLDPTQLGGNEAPHPPAYSPTTHFPSPPPNPPSNHPPLVTSEQDLPPLSQNDTGEHGEGWDHCKWRTPCESLTSAIIRGSHTLRRHRLRRSANDLLQKRQRT
ncbi:hypothetical protein JAAARDRAFT_435801 [Jaapia argillacea MUCL 33604]|uniref:Uncharacterized protein n=1 Tax=Jaapia argillacea MUCL 33604 TaxID=933084 RepID=A0A067PED8_9AGAM|nr:hypothetical protein JAAARDRAFT_435801 [Jaapia argillacea MUCL 33604]